MLIKALSLHQPWATLIATGAKRIETRAWQTPHRGLLAIHATRDLSREAAALCGTSPFREALLAAGLAGPDDLPRGCVLAIVRVTGCTPIEAPPAEPEATFGDYSPGRFAWQLDDIGALPEPLAARGAQGVWSCEAPDGLLQARVEALTRPEFGRASGYS